MGWLSNLFKRPPKDATFAQMLDGFIPIYSQFGTDIYASDVVQQALRCIVDEMMKLNPTHIRMKGSDPVPVTKGTVQEVLSNPNPLMTSSEFIGKIVWMLLLNYNAFVIPTYWTWTDEKTGEERRYYEGLYPINPSSVDFIEDKTGRLFVTFTFRNGTRTTFPYDDIIHIRYNYSINEYMGGGENGQPDRRGILQTLDLNDKMLKGIAKAMSASYAMNGIVKYNSVIDDGKLEKAIAKFERRLANSESGFLPIDLKGDVIPFERKVAMVDAATLKFMDEKILRNWGIPLCILTGDYTQEQYNSFYQSRLEPLIIAIGQAFTKKMFTRRERAFGNKIEMYPKELVFLSMSQTLEAINMLAPTGGMFENEKRTALGMRPLPELEGKRYISLNWIEASQAAAYQVGDDTKEEGEE